MINNRFTTVAARIANAEDDIVEELARVISVSKAGMHPSAKLGGANTCTAFVELSSKPGTIRRITGFGSLAGTVSRLDEGQEVRISGRTEGKNAYGRFLASPYVVLSEIHVVSARATVPIDNTDV